MRGEKFAARASSFKMEGSPPRARGKVPFSYPMLAMSGITPACAGKSSPPCAPSAENWDHPRVRGEKPCW